jgi:hypothetical protein
VKIDPARDFGQNPATDSPGEIPKPQGRGNVHVVAGVRRHGGSNANRRAPISTLPAQAT